MRILFFIFLIASAIPLRSSEPGLHYIGTQRQFFFDETIVEKLVNTRTRLNPAVKVQPNPILQIDKPWEGSDTTISWVFFDELLQKFRLRYTTGKMLAAGRNQKGEVVVKGDEHNPTPRVTCEAFSDDGIHWQKPELGLVDFNGSKANNILPAEYIKVEYCFQDLHEKDPNKRYKGFVRKGDVHIPGYDRRPLFFT